MPPRLQNNHKIQRMKVPFLDEFLLRALEILEGSYSQQLQCRRRGVSKNGDVVVNAWVISDGCPSISRALIVQAWRKESIHMRQVLLSESSSSEPYYFLEPLLLHQDGGGERRSRGRRRQPPFLSAFWFPRIGTSGSRSRSMLVSTDLSFKCRCKKVGGMIANVESL